MTNSKQLLKASLFTLGLLMSSLPVAYAATDTTDTAAENAVESTADTATDTATSAENAVENTADAAQDQAQGFDDWGLLGLAGLLGLLGLRGNNNRNVVVDGTRR